MALLVSSCLKNCTETAQQITDLQYCTETAQQDTDHHDFTEKAQQDTSYSDCCATPEQKQCDHGLGAWFTSGLVETEGLVPLAHAKS